MPEGDIVLRTARRLHTAFAGHALTVSDLRWPSLATVDLTGREVLEVVAVGKHLLARFAGKPDGGLTLHSHLRMDGSWRLTRTGPGADRRPFRPGDHRIRAVLADQHWTAAGYRLGMLDLVPTDAEARLVGHLGPDILAPGWDPVPVAATIAALPQLAIGEALLDQRVLAGIGTFYLAEACFLRGVLPWTPAGEVDVEALLRMAHRLMSQNVDRAVQVTTGDARRGEEQWVHARSGRPCRRCGRPVRVASLGTAPQERVVFYCAHCQGGLAPSDDGRRQQPLGSARR